MMTVRTVLPAVFVLGVPGCGLSTAASFPTAAADGSGDGALTVVGAPDGASTGLEDAASDAAALGKGEAGPLADAAMAIGFTPGLHVVMGSGGTPGKILDGAGNLVQLHGVDRSGTEYMCLSGGFADGPVDQAGVDAMKSWHINAVRVPMNEDCWLGINGVPGAYSGASYQKAIASWVDLITSNGMVAIVDLHWTAPGTTLANGQEPMADADHAPTFWSQVASAFASNGLVIFDLFNEPYITDWTCWVSGGSCATENGTSYTAAGMATLLQAVRDAGANNVVMLGGLGYSSDNSSWVSAVTGIPKLGAPLNGISIANVACSLHLYDFSNTGCPSQYNGYSGACDSAATTMTNASVTSVLDAGFPLVMGESGISVFSSASAARFTATQQAGLESWYDDLLTWTEGQGQSYLAWSWDTDTDPVLVTDYTTYAPTEGFGVTYRAHLQKF